MANMAMNPSAPASADAPETTAVISPDPPRAQQPNLLTLTISGSDGKPLAGATVKAAVAMTSMDMGTTYPAIHELGSGKYQGSITFAMAGAWRVSVTVTAPGEKPQTKTLEYTVSR